MVWNQTRKDLECETGEFVAHLTGNGEFLKKLRWGAMLAELHCFLRKRSYFGKAKKTRGSDQLDSFIE